MGWLISRVVTTALLVFLGAEVGMMLGYDWGVPSFGAALGRRCRRRHCWWRSTRCAARRLLVWLRGDRSDAGAARPGHLG